MSDVAKALGDIETALERLIGKARIACCNIEDCSYRVWRDIGFPLDEAIGEAEETLAKSREVLAKFISSPK